VKNIFKKVQYYSDRLVCSDGHDYARILLGRNYFHRQGENCYVDFSVMVDEPFLVTLGRNVWLTDDVKILTHDGALSMLSRKTGEKLRKFGAVRIGDNVFVGMAACLMPGISIGNNAVIATGSVVTRDVPAGSIVGGNPARIIGKVGDYMEKWRHRQTDFGYENSGEKESYLVRNLMGDI